MEYKEGKFGYVVKNGILAFQKGPFSQWYGFYKDQHSDFVYNGVKFNCSEQWMMAQKACLFNDEESFKAVMSTPSPREQKAIGRRVKGYDQVHWDNCKYGIVRYGNILKFSQNEDLREFLLGTVGLTLVEAAPWDKVWGVGTGPENDSTFDPERWKGSNLLGKAVEETRATLNAYGVLPFKFGEDR
jgi:ribA/ribD-fused uncharacterized protein